MIFYLLKDLSCLQHDTTELSTAFARDVHLEKRFWTFIEGLWALDHLDFPTAVGNLTHPSIIPTFPDEILYVLLKGRENMVRIGIFNRAQDDIFPLAYFNSVKPPLEDAKVRDEFATYLACRNVTETYYWIQGRPEHEQESLLDILVKETLQPSAFVSVNPKNDIYPRNDRAIELVSLPFTKDEEAHIEKFLIEGKGRTILGAMDTVLLRRIATGRMAEVAGETATRGKKFDGMNWEMLKDGVKRGLGPRKAEEVFLDV